MTCTLKHTKRVLWLFAVLILVTSYTAEAGMGDLASKVQDELYGPTSLCTCEGDEHTAKPAMFMENSLDGVPFQRIGFEGEEVWKVPLRLNQIDFRKVYVVAVTGTFPNPCGHAILNIGGPSGWYIHIAGVYRKPLVMNEQGYRRYLAEAGKSEIRRWTVYLQNPNAARAALNNLLYKKWLWGVLPHNCVSFIEQIVRAGGSKAGMYSNCPSRENFT